MQVMKTLQILMEDNYTMTEIIARLNTNEQEAIFNNSVVSKYINTCRYLGIDIPKIHNKYFVASLPFGLDFTDREIDLLVFLQNAAKNGISTKSKKIFEKWITRLTKYCNKKIIRVESSSTEKVFDEFEIAVKNKQKIELMFRSKATMKCIPLALVQKKNKMFFISKNLDNYIRIYAHARE